MPSPVAVIGRSILFLLLARTAHAPLAAQDAAPVEAAPDEEELEAEDDEIVVTGRRIAAGSVIGDIAPEVQLDARDIRALGAGSLSELLDALAPQTRSGRGRGEGRPVVLLNGRRISGFSETRDIPPEAIVRVDILPEEVALKYGYRADQRVVNFVLRPRFKAITAEVEAGMATAGGRGSYEADFTYLRIGKAGRLNFDAEYERQGALFESERDLIQDPEEPEGSGDFRTLLAASDRLALNATHSRTVLGKVAATLNGRFEATGSSSALGLPSATLLVPAGNLYSPGSANTQLQTYFGDLGAIGSTASGQAAHLGLALNGDAAPWRWSLTANYDRDRNVRTTDGRPDLAAAQALLDAGDPAFDPFAPIAPELVAIGPRDRSVTVAGTGNVEFVANGPIVNLPAGPLSASLKVGAETLSFEGRSTNGGIERERAFSRERGSGQASLDIPIASRKRNVLTALGDLSANINVAADRLSDFGTLRTLGAGVNWSPVEEVELIASITDEDGAPSVQQLGDPALTIPGFRVFDLVRGETVDVVRIDGGNPNLRADNRRVMKLGLNVKPWEERDLSLTANYTSSRILDPIASFPTATPEFEAAFPDRFTRDAGGRLIRIDSRPVNFARTDRDEFRWGINFSKPIGKARTARAGREGPPVDQAARAARRAGRGFSGRGFGGRGGPEGRLQLALYHNIALQDSILIRPGVPELDLLGGSAVGSGGGRPRHELDFQAGLFKDGFGARLNGRWRSGTEVTGGTGTEMGGGSGDLSFSSLATVNLRLFADLGRQRKLVEKAPWLRGTRLSLAVDNLIDSALRVRDASGATPLGYQSAYLDPLGRSVRIELRKLFF
jgi:hypothetical protein